LSVLLGVDELAEILHKSPSSIRSDASRNKSALPPICRLPGTKRLLFRAEDVDAWIAGYVDRAQGGRLQESLVEPTKRGRGRPPKTAALFLHGSHSLTRLGDE